MNFQGHDLAAAPRRFAGALGVSVLLHLLVLGVAPGLSPREPRATAIDATLRPASEPAQSAVEPTAAQVAPHPAPPAPVRAAASEHPPAVVAVEAGSFAAPESPPLPAPAVGVPAGTGAATPVPPTTTALSRGAAGPAGSVTGPAPVDGLDPNGLRQYRLALAVQARRFMRYPPRAREAGWSGRTEVRIDVASSGVPRPPEVARSSGYETLDAAAMEMVGRAVQRAGVPESLRGRAFSVVVPVEFDLTEP